MANPEASGQRGRTLVKATMLGVGAVGALAGCSTGVLHGDFTGDGISVVDAGEGGDQTVATATTVTTYLGPQVGNAFSLAMPISETRRIGVRISGWNDGIHYNKLGDVKSPLGITTIPYGRNQVDDEARGVTNITFLPIKNQSTGKVRVTVVRVSGGYDPSAGQEGTTIDQWVLDGDKTDLAHKVELYDKDGHKLKSKPIGVNYYQETNVQDLTDGDPNKQDKGLRQALENVASWQGVESSDSEKVKHQKLSALVNAPAVTNAIGKLENRARGKAEEKFRAQPDHRQDNVNKTWVDDAKSQVNHLPAPNKSAPGNTWDHIKKKVHDLVPW